MPKVYVQKTSDLGKIPVYADVASLPGAPTVTNQIALVLADMTIYAWNGSAWLATGSAFAKNTPGPESHRLLAWAFDPALSASATAPAAGVLNLIKIPVPKQITVAQVAVVLGVGGSGATPLANCYFAVFNAAGTRLGVTADQSAALATSQNRTFPLTQDSGQSLVVGGTPSDYVWGGMMIGTQATTALTILRPQGGTAAMSIGMSAAPWRAGTILSGLSAMPTSFTPSGMAAAQSFFLGLL
jgi:hypothetical protein